MIGPMHNSEHKTVPEAAQSDEKAEAPATLPTAYIPACGTLCDAFWWARPSYRPKSSD
jgi:hypothetical protein